MIKVLLNLYFRYFLHLRYRFNHVIVTKITHVFIKKFKPKIKNYIMYNGYHKL